MLKKERIIDTNFFTTLSENLKIIDDVDTLEYVFLDKITRNNIKNQFLKNKMILTSNEKYGICMLDNQEKDVEKQLTQLNYNRIVDLIIINDLNDSVNENIKKIIDKHTIIAKVLSNEIIYIEDIDKEVLILVTPHQKYVIKNRGVNAKLMYGEFNT